MPNDSPERACNSDEKWRSFPTTPILAPFLEPRQHKNDSVQSKETLVLKLARFFPSQTGDKKEREFQTWHFFRLNGVVPILSLF